jgi:hypothetical protein
MHARDTFEEPYRTPTEDLSERGGMGVGLSAIQERFVRLQVDIENEYLLLEKAWDEAFAVTSAVDAIRNRILASHVPFNDRLRLNVGGQRFEIRRQTALKNTFLNMLIKKSIGDADTDGTFFICRNPKWFQVLLNHLREGTTDLTPYTEIELLQLRADAEFFSASDLVAMIDKQRHSKKAEVALQVLSFSSSRPVSHTFHGVAIEVAIQRKECRLHSVSIVAGERRRLTIELYHKEGAFDAPGQLRKLSECEVQAEREQLISLAFTAIPLVQGTHTLCVYCPNCSTGIAVVPRREATRKQHGLDVTRSYHITDSKGVITKRAGEDDYDFCGDIALSFGQ